MGRHLTPGEAAAALRRGAEVEQLVSLAADRLGFLTCQRFDSTGEFQLSRHEVEDVGHEGFRDISEFPPVDADEESWGEEAGRFEAAEDAVAAAGDHDGSAERWLNAGLAADAYWAAKTGGASA